MSWHSCWVSDRTSDWREEVSAERKDNDAEFATPQDILGELRADNLHMVESLRHAKEVADEAKDNVTSGLIDTWTDEAERRAWFLFEVSR